MEFLEQFADWFNAFTAWVERFLAKLFGSSNERRIRQIGFVRDKKGLATIVPGSVTE